MARPSKDNDQRAPSVIREWKRLWKESRDAGIGPYWTTNEMIERERTRHDWARELVKEGRAEEARRVAWWPPSEEFPKRHWSQVPVARCSCRFNFPFGDLRLCGSCGGATSETPSAIPREET